MLDTSGFPSESLVTAECSSFEEFKNSKTIPTRRRRVKKSRDNSATLPKRPDFFLGGDKNTYELPEYNGLKDEHLIGHFYNKKLRKLLVKNGLISKGGRVVEIKTCLNNSEITKHTFNIDNQDVGFKSIRGGTMILGVKLPKIESQTSANSTTTNTVTNTKRRRASSAMHSEYQSVDTSFHGTPITPIENPDKLSLTHSRLNDSSMLDNSFSKQNTSLTNFRSTGGREKSDKSINKSMEKRRKKTPKAVPVKVLPNLQPMTKEDLKAAIERHKHKLNETTIVDESPELNQVASGNSSQRVSERQTSQNEQVSRLDSRNRSRVLRERVGSQDADRESSSKRESVKEKSFIVRGGSFSQSPTNQEKGTKVQKEAKNMKIRMSKMLENNPYQERMSPLEKHAEFKPSRGVETPVKKMREKTVSPSSRSKELSEKDREGKERVPTGRMGTEEGSLSPTQKNVAVMQGKKESTRYSKREVSSRQSAARPSTSSKVQEEKSSRGKESDPMNKDSVRQNTQEQESVEQEKVADQETNRSVKKEKVMKSKTVRPSTSSKAQENSRSFMRKSVASPEKEETEPGEKEKEGKDDKKKRGASAGGNVTREIKLRTMGTVPNVPVQNVKAQKESSQNLKREGSQISQSPSQRDQQSERTLEVIEVKLEKKESSKTQIQQGVGSGKVQKEKKELRTSANGLNQSHGKIKTNTPEKKLARQGTGKVSEGVKAEVESKQQDENQEVKGPNIEQLSNILFGSVLNVMPLDKALKDRIKEAFRQRHLPSDPATRRTESQSPNKDAKGPEKV